MMESFKNFIKVTLIGAPLLNKMIGIFLPFPGTGAWTGALIAALLQFNRKRSFFYIGLGVVIAAVIMTLASYGVISLFAPKH